MQHPLRISITCIAFAVLTACQTTTQNSGQDSLQHSGKSITPIADEPVAKVSAPHLTANNHIVAHNASTITLG